MYNNTMSTAMVVNVTIILTSPEDVAMLLPVLVHLPPGQTPSHWDWTMEAGSETDSLKTTQKHTNTPPVTFPPLLLWVLFKNLIQVFTEYDRLNQSTSALF